MTFFTNNFWLCIWAIGFVAVQVALAKPSNSDINDLGCNLLMAALWPLLFVAGLLMLPTIVTMIIKTRIQDKSKSKEERK